MERPGTDSGLQDVRSSEVQDMPLFPFKEKPAISHTPRVETIVVEEKEKTRPFISAPPHILGFGFENIRISPYYSKVCILRLPLSASLLQAQTPEGMSPGGLKSLTTYLPHTLAV